MNKRTVSLLLHTPCMLCKLVNPEKIECDSNTRMHHCSLWQEAFCVQWKETCKFLREVTETKEDP